MRKLDISSKVSTQPRATGSFKLVRGGGSGEAPAKNSKTTAIPLALPPLEAMALAHFVKQLDFETVVGFASVAVACDDGKSEADLVWLALIELRSALAVAASAFDNVRDAGNPS